MIPAASAAAIDQLVTVEYRSAHLNAGTLPALCAAARAAIGGSPCGVAAQRLAAALASPAPVVLATGAGGPPWLFNGETDGPPGIAGLARALALGWGASPIVITEPRSIAPVTATFVAAGVSVLPEAMARVRPTTATLLPFTDDPAAAPAAAREFLDRHRPAAIVTVEKTSPNRAGVIHSVTGKPWTPGVDFARVEALIDEARRRGILTIGIGDMGNEMGFGLIEETVRRTVPRADVCQCPCGQGMASAVATDVLVPASVSNWGAYAIEAGLAIVAGRPELMHDADTERAMLHACVAAGAVDGVTSRQILAVDGTPEAVQLGIVAMLGTLVAKALEPGKVEY